MLFIFYVIGTFHCSIRIYNDLDEGDKIYSKMNPSLDGYQKTTITTDSNGNKYTTDRDGDPQFRITKWDVIMGRIITEEEYLNMQD